MRPRRPDRVQQSEVARLVGHCGPPLRGGIGAVTVPHSRVAASPGAVLADPAVGVGDPGRDARRSLARAPRPCHGDRAACVRAARSRRRGRPVPWPRRPRRGPRCGAVGGRAARGPTASKFVVGRHAVEAAGLDAEHPELEQRQHALRGLAAVAVVAWIAEAHSQRVPGLPPSPRSSALSRAGRTPCCRARSAGCGCPGADR